eukprot:PITA_22187
MFSSLHDCNTKNIYVGDDRSLNVVGTGTVHLDNGQFNDVLCVPTLPSNLLSVYQITHSGEGKIVEFSPHDVVIKDLRDPNQILATGIADDSTRLYKFHNFGSSNLPSVFVAHNDEVSKLWHERFGHLNYRSLQHLCKENMVTGLPMVSCRDGVCSDVRTWVYFLKLKSEVFNTFLAFKGFVEKQSGHQILKLRTDNGGEYVKNTFINFCTENEIQMQHIVPYTPQQNGVAERKNRTLKEMANYVKGYRLIPFKSKTVIIRRDVKFDENKSACEPSPADVPPLPISSTFENISSSDDESEDDNTPPPSQDPQLPRWVRATRDAAGDLAGDPTDQRRTRSQFERASSLLAQAPVNHDPDTFAEASGHPHWETAMNEEYHSLLANDTWDLVPLPKGRKLVRCKCVYRTKYGPDGKVDKHKARLVAKGFS